MTFRIFFFFPMAPPSIPHLFAIVLDVFSLLFLAIALARVRKYMRKNFFEESRHTLVFGFLHLKMYVYAYIFFVVVLCILFFILLNV